MLELLGGQRCVLTANEIAERLRGAGRPVAIATIYRTLEALDEHGLVRRLEIGGGQPTRYEAAQPSGAEHHHHLVCASCRRAFPFEDGELEAAIDAVAERLEHTVVDHEVVLSGVCRECG